MISVGSGQGCDCPSRVLPRAGDVAVDRPNVVPYMKKPFTQDSKIHNESWIGNPKDVGQEFSEL